MDPVAIQQALNDVYDQAIWFHAFTDYMRDYEVVVHIDPDPNSGIRPTTFRYLFRYCVEAHTNSALPPEQWARSLDDRLIDYETGKHMDGYVWGVKWQLLYPGGHVVQDSPTARRWETALGIPFHEVRFDTNSHDITLVFHDLEVTKIGPGFVSYALPSEG